MESYGTVKKHKYDDTIRKGGQGMLYRKFGKTGKDISIIGMGGMRFDPEMYQKGDIDACADVMVHAYKQGINYFDTAPLYCHDMSREIFSRGIKQMDRSKIFITSKASPENTGEKTEDDMLRAIENNLKILGVDYIDFFHLWCVLSFEMFERYEKMGMVRALHKAKELGMIRHANISTHASGEEIAKMLETGYFEGCLLNYNATNFAFRQKGLEAAKRLNIGVITMNPLGGGMIPRNPKFYEFLQEDENDTAVKGAIRFNASHPELNVVLVGATYKEHIDEACQAITNLKPITTEQLKHVKAHLTENLNSLCTMCGYCKGCPADIEIPKMMDSYNQYLLDPENPKAITSRLNAHWGLSAEQAAKCIACGSCESKCTQHLPIIDRLAEIAELTQQK